MFAVFAGFLLYLCAIITSNVSYFGKTGAFYGLNPIPGLTEFLGATLLLFVIFIILIFTSVSSYVFERKKGVGIEVKDKEEKGYSRWAKDREMKNDKGVVEVSPTATELDAAGIPLVNDGKRLWVDNGEYHNLVIGSTGSGKSQTIVEPMVELLIKHGESMIITDPKGELYAAASDYMRERGYNVVVLNFREPQRGNSWNPLTLPYQYYKDGNIDKSTELLDDVAANILYDPNNKSGDPFWEKSAADYFSGLCLGLFEDATVEQINLNSINYMSTMGEEKLGANTYIKEYFTLKGESSSAYISASNTFNAPSDTKGSILSVFRQKIKQFSTRENLSEMLSYSDFDMRKIGKEKTAVFIVIHDEKTTYHGLATIFIKQCYETLIDVAQGNGGQLPYRTNFILDEFANMPPLKDVTTMVTAARSRKIRFTFIIQNFAQLKSVYGNEDAETIKGNCGNLVYLISTELSALEEISKMCGEVKSKDSEKTSSTPLVTVTDLQKLKMFEAIIIRWRMSPFKTKYTPNFKMDWGHEKSSASYPTREKKEIQLFDIKEFTKKKKSEKIKNSLNERNDSIGGSNPFKSSNPFMGGSGMGGPGMGGFDRESDLGSLGPNPFAARPERHQNEDSGLFGGLGGGIDFDAMLKDIDKKIAELDAEEARQKEEEAKLKNKDDKKEEKNSTNSLIGEDDIIVPMKSDDEIGFNPMVSKKDDDINIKTTIDLDKPKTDKKDDDFEIKIPSFNTYDAKIEPVKDDDDEVAAKQKEIDDLKKQLAELKAEKDEKKEVKEQGRRVTSYSTNDRKNADINISTDKANIAVATSSPEEDDFEFEALPDVQNASIIQPTYNSGVVVKTSTNNNSNIYDKVPNIVGEVKDDIKTSNEVRKETNNFVDSISVSKDKLDNIANKLNNYSNKVEDADKVNVNIDPDKITISDNAVTDDEFFDDFFGDE